MTKPSALEAIIKLQHIIAQTQEAGDVFQKFLPATLHQLNELGFTYQLIGTLFLDGGKQVKKSSVAFNAIPTGAQAIDLNIFNLSEILKNENGTAQEHLWDPLVVTDQIQPVISNSYPGYDSLRSVVISFIHPSKDLMGAFVLATSRQVTEISDEEKQLIELLTNQIGLIHRLQETHDSLTSISKEVYKMNFQLHELDKMKTEFVSLASHELLTPISAIEGYLSMLLDEKIVDPQSAKGIEYLHRIYGASKRLAKLVTDLLNVSRIEEGRLLIQSKALNINQIVDTVVGELRFKAKERNLQLNWQAGEWPLVFADDDKLKEIVVNLVGNAVKYTNEGTITVSIEAVPTSTITAVDKKQQAFLKTPMGGEVLSRKIETERRTLVGDTQLVVNVTDTGIGIPPEEINNVFRKFYRIGDITTQQTQGTGLGLYISRSLVEMMHGRMWVSSPGRGKGSTFSFSLPLDIYEPQIKQAEQSIKVADTAKPLAHSSQFEF